MVKSEQLRPHTGLVAEEVSLHSIHKLDETPEGYGVILHYGINRRKKIAHPLDIAKLLVVLVVSKEHVFHLLEVNISPRLSER